MSSVIYILKCGSITQSCPALCGPMDCCPTRQSSEPPRKFLHISMNEFISILIFLSRMKRREHGDTGHTVGWKWRGQGTLGSKQRWNGRSSLLEQATRSSLPLGTSHVLLCSDLDSLLFALPWSTLIMPTPHSLWWKFFLQKHSGTDYPLALRSLLATPRLVFGICLLSGLGIDLAHIASPGAQVCAQLIPKLNLISSFPPGAASRWDSQAHQASDLPGVGVRRSRGPVQLQGGPGGGAFLQKSTLGLGRGRRGGAGQGRWRHRETCAVKILFKKNQTYLFSLVFRFFFLNLFGNISLNCAHFNFCLFIYFYYFFGCIGSLLRQASFSYSIGFWSTWTQ